VDESGSSGDQPDITARLIKTRRSRLSSNRRVTIADVARLAKVSTASVSRALTDPAAVTEDTRLAVMEAVARTGYRPNGLARALRKQATRSVLALVADLTNPFYPAIILGMEQQAQERDYTVLMGHTGADPRREASYMELLRDQRADGVLLMTGCLPAGCPLSGPDRPPMVFVSEYLPGSDIPKVRIDNAEAAYGAVGYLLELGHRRIAHISGPITRMISPERQAGYMRALMAAGIEVAPELMVNGDFRYESGMAACAKLLSLAQPPTAIFCANDEMAAGAVKAIRSRGLRVPDDVSVVGFDDIQIAEMCDPPLTTVRQPRARMGQIAMDMLIRLLEGMGDVEVEVTLEAELIIRGSTAPPKSAV
jgi:LacI family transcriptional regulator, repressor for deo operon, udp, cdd, tsx, nupC, and nupG